MWIFVSFSDRKHGLASFKNKMRENTQSNTCFCTKHMYFCTNVPRYGLAVKRMPRCVLREDVRVRLLSLLRSLKMPCLILEAKYFNAFLDGRKTVSSVTLKTCMHGCKNVFANIRGIASCSCLIRFYKSTAAMTTWAFRTRFILTYLTSDG